MERVFSQNHGGGFESHAVKCFLYGAFLGQNGPGNLKDRTHTGAGGSAGQRVAARFGEENGVHTQSGGGAKDGAHIGGIHHIFQHGDTARPGADRFGIGYFGTGENGENPSCEVKTGELGDHLGFGGEEGRIRGGAGDDFFGRALDMLFLH